MRKKGAICSIIYLYVHDNLNMPFEPGNEDMLIPSA